MLNSASRVVRGRPLETRGGIGAQRRVVIGSDAACQMDLPMSRLRPRRRHRLAARTRRSCRPSAASLVAATRAEGSTLSRPPCRASALDRRSAVPAQPRPRRRLPRSRRSQPPPPPMPAIGPHPGPGAAASSDRERRAGLGRSAIDDASAPCTPSSLQGRRPRRRRAAVGIVSPQQDPARSSRPPSSSARAGSNGRTAAIQPGRRASDEPRTNGRQDRRPIEMARMRSSNEPGRLGRDARAPNAPARHQPVGVHVNLWSNAARILPSTMAPNAFINEHRLRPMLSCLQPHRRRTGPATEPPRP